MQFVGAEHPEGEHNEQAREQDENPGLVKCSLQLHARSGGRDACTGVDDRHAEHVRQRQRETARRCYAFAFSGNDARQDWHHWQYAGRESKTKTGEEEEACRDPHAGTSDDVCETSLFADRRILGGRQRTCRCRFRQADFEYARLRHVTKAAFGTSLVAELQLEVHCLRCCACYSEFAEESVEIDFHLTKILIGLHLA